MKILHIIPTYIPANFASGPIQSIHSLNKELVNMGVEVTVYTSNFDGDKVLDVPVLKEVMVDGVRVFYFPLTMRLWSYSREFHKALKKNSKNFDLIHISSIFLSFLMLGAHYARKVSVPYIISTHGILMKNPLTSKSLKKRLYIAILEKRNLARAEAICFTTLSERDEYLEASLPIKKSIVVPHGISLEDEISHPRVDFFRDKFNISKKEKIVLFLGRLNWIKGFDTLLPAFANVLKQEKEATLVIAGPDGGYKKEIDKLIEKLSIKEKVLYAGLLEGEEKVSALLESNVFVLLSYSENFSVVTTEAMNLGLPVVITRGVGISYLVEQYGAGIVVEKEIEKVSLAILRILQNPDLAKKMKEQGKKLVETEFVPQKVALRMLNEYQQIIKEY